MIFVDHLVFAVISLVAATPCNGNFVFGFYSEPGIVVIPPEVRLSASLSS